MGFLDGMLGGFTERKYAVEAETQARATQTSAREAEIFKALLSSSDPQVQAIAATGLLESANPKKKKGGLRGWLGEVESSSYLPQMQALINTQVETDPGTMAEPPSTQYPSLATPPPSLGEAPAGMPAQALTTPGSVPAPRPAPRQMPGKVGTPPTMGPRKIFPTSEDQAIEAARGKARGDVEGDFAGLVAAGIPEAEAREIIKAERLRLARGGQTSQSIAGEVVGPDGRATPEYGIFDRQRQGYVYPAGHPSAGQPIPGFRPRTTTGSRSLGADREAISRELYNLSASQLTSTQMQVVNDTVIQRTRDIARQRGLGTGEAKIATELATPIGPSMARQYNVSPTTTLGELADTIGLSDTQKDRVYALSQIDVLVNDIEALIPQVFPNVQEGIKGTIKSAFSLGLQKLAGDADLAALDASINAALAQVAQLSGQPGSRLSDRDIDLAKSTLASLQPSLFGGDTINTARARVQVIKNLLAKANESIPTTSQIGGAPPRASQENRTGDPSQVSTLPNGPNRAPPTALGTPPPTNGNRSGPAGWFVDANGKLVQQ